jgi:hypothetical protein
MAQTATIPRPELTLPEAEAARLQDAYAQAGVILEYGSGGSTVMAAELPGKQVFTVESDQAWAQMMRAWFEQAPPVAGTEVDIIWSDIGETKEWGYPATNSEWQRYARYPLEVWDLPEFRQPDVVLVDGRFRAGCVLAAAFRTQAPVRVFVDDYARRRHYHRVEAFVGEPVMTGRMAEFEVSPMAVPGDRLLSIVEMMTRP